MAAGSESGIPGSQTDFGGLRHAVPRAVHRPPLTFPSMVLAAGRPVALRGAGHSCDGQTVTDGDLLVTYAEDGAVEQIRDLGDGRFEVPAGMNWYDLERHLNRQGRSVPVLTDHLRVSVGGTLSVGGIGVGSVRHGMQVDSVERIQLIDGTGVSRWCSRTEHSELFRFALGGLGTAGLIERAVLRTERYRRYTHVHRVGHAGAADVVEHAEQVALRDDVDSYRAMMRRNRWTSETGWRADGPRRSDGSGSEDGLRTCADLPLAGRHNRVGLRPPASGTVHLWTDYVVPAGALGPMIEAVERQRRRAPLDRVSTMVLILLVRRPAGAVPFAFAPAAAAPVSIGVGVYCTADRNVDDIGAIRGVLRELLEQCCELGGRPYLYGVNDLDDDLAGRLYGGDLDILAQLRSTHRLGHVNSRLPLALLAERRGLASRDLPVAR
ncbi:MAG: FAD-binding protein [Mycobacteriaceae bacterium]|nr:FAD-binding protein [Mycobacteriaceae bacterium]